MSGQRSSHSSLTRTPLPQKPQLTPPRANTRPTSPQARVASPVVTKIAPPPARTPVRVEPARREETREDLRNARSAPTSLRPSEPRPSHLTLSSRPSRQYSQRAEYESGNDERIYVRPKSQTHTVSTPNGTFQIPNFDLMDDTEIMRYLNSYTVKFAQMNDDWKHLGITFDAPRPGEHISNVAIRYLETEKHLSTKTGSDFWFIILCGVWGFIEYTACEYELPAEGYASSQISMYKMYQSQLVRMGASSGFGTEWSPWMQVTVTSCANLAVLIVVAKMCPAAKGEAPMLMREISQVISGNKDVELSAEGTPKPSVGGLQGIVTSVMSGGGGGGGGGVIDGFMGLLSGVIGGGGKSKKKRSKKQKTKEVAARRGDDDDLDC